MPGDPELDPEPEELELPELPELLEVPELLPDPPELLLDPPSPTPGEVVEPLHPPELAPTSRSAGTIPRSNRTEWIMGIRMPRAGAWPVPGATGRFRCLFRCHVVPGPLTVPAPRTPAFPAPPRTARLRSRGTLRAAGRAATTRVRDRR